MKKIFISYSREDYLDEQGQISAGSPVSEIVEALKAAPEIDVWIDVESRYSGQYFTTILAKQILWADKILFLSSKNSNASEWVSQELLFAYNNKKEIVPILLDDTPYNLDFALFLTGIDHIEYYKNPRQNLSYIIENLGDLKIYSEPQLSTPLEKEPSPQKKKDGFLLKTNYKGCALTLSIALSLFIVFVFFLKLPGEESIPNPTGSAPPEEEGLVQACPSNEPQDDMTFFLIEDRYSYFDEDYYGYYAILEYNWWDIIDDGNERSLFRVMSLSEGKEKRLVLMQYDNQKNIIEHTFSAEDREAYYLLRDITRRTGDRRLLKTYIEWKNNKSKIER